MTYKGDHNMIEKQVAALVAQGVDCTQWAQSHGIAMSETATKSDTPAAISHRAKIAEAAALENLFEQRRHFLTGLGLLHAPHEYNNGKTDAQRLALAEQMAKTKNAINVSSKNALPNTTITWGGDGAVGPVTPREYLSTQAQPPLGGWYQYPGNPSVSSQAFTFYSQEQPVVVTGKQFVVVCNGRVEYEDDKAKAQATAERLAHANQVDAFILKPVSRTAPKRDVVTTEIKL